jgi:hypothetical protein
MPCPRRSGICGCGCGCGCVWVWVCVCMCACMCGRMYMCMNIVLDLARMPGSHRSGMCMCMYLCMHVCMYV